MYILMCFYALLAFHTATLSFRRFDDMSYVNDYMNFVMRWR